MGWFKKYEKNEEFEVFNKYKNLKYFDSACVTLKPNTVLDKINQYYSSYPSCAGRSAHFLAERVQEEVEKSRNRIKKYFNVDKNGEILFTKNTTESINLIANSMKNIKTVLFTDKEHNSNYLPWLKYEPIILPCKEELDLEELEIKCRKCRVDLVSIHYASNIDGKILDIESIISIAHKYDTPVLLDAAQMAAHEKIDVSKLDVDFLVCSGHKMYGPSGIGILYAKKKYLNDMSTYIIGGDTVDDVNGREYKLLELPNKFEAGLQDYAGIIGMGTAIDFLDKKLSTIKKYCQEGLEIFFEELKDLDSIEILSSRKNNAGIFAFIPKKISAKELGIILSEQGICVRTGNFCTHNWFNTYDKDFAIRFSLSYNTTPEDVRFVCEILRRYI